MNYKLLIFCILFHNAYYVLASEKPNIRKPFVCSEGETFSCTDKSNKIQRFIVSTIAQEHDKAHSNYTAIYLRNVDNNEEDVVIKQTQKEVLSSNPINKGLIQNSHETLYTARLKQINERAKSQGKEFNMFNAKYKLIKTICYDASECAYAEYEKKNLFYDDLATFIANKASGIVQVSENRNRKYHLDRIAISGIAVAAMIGCITYGAYKKFIKS